MIINAIHKQSDDKVKPSDSSKRVVPMKDVVNAESKDRRFKDVIVRVNNVCTNGFFSSKHMKSLTHQLDSIARIGKELLDNEGSNTDFFLAWDTFMVDIEHYLEMKEPKRRATYLTEELDFLEEKMLNLQEKKRLWGIEKDYLSTEWTTISTALESIRSEISQITTAKQFRHNLNRVVSLLNQFHHNLRTDYTDYFKFLVPDKLIRARIVFECCFIVKRAVQGADLSFSYEQTQKDMNVKKTIKHANVVVKSMFDPGYEFVAHESSLSEPEASKPVSSSESDTYRSTRTPLDRSIEAKYKVWNSVDRKKTPRKQATSIRPEVELTPCEKKDAKPAPVKITQRSKSVSDLTTELKKAKTEKKELLHQIKNIKNTRNSLKNTRSTVIANRMTEKESLQAQIAKLKSEIDEKTREHLALQKKENEILMRRKSSQPSSYYKGMIQVLEDACSHYSKIVKSLEDEISGSIHPTVDVSHVKDNSYSSELPQPVKPVASLRRLDYSSSESDCSNNDADYSNEPNINFSEGSHDLGDFEMPVHGSTSVSAELADYRVIQNNDLKIEWNELVTELESLEFEKNEMILETEDIYKAYQSVQAHTQMMVDDIRDYEKLMKEKEHRIQLFIETQPLKVRNCVKEATVQLEERLRQMRACTADLAAQREQMGSGKAEHSKYHRLVRPVTIADVSEKSRTTFMSLERSRENVKKTIKRLMSVVKEAEAAEKQAAADTASLDAVAASVLRTSDPILLRIETENARMETEIAKLETTIHKIVKNFDLSTPKGNLSKQLMNLKKVVSSFVNRSYVL